MSHEVEPRNSTPLNPSKEAISEMSFGAAIRRAIEDLFTYQAIAEKVQTIPPNDVLETLVETWKQGLATRLQGEAQATVENVSAILDLLQSDEPLSAVEPMEWLRAERQFTPFPIASVCRDNLRGILLPEEIAGLSEQEMSQIATQMGEAFQGSEFYWQSLEVTAKAVLAERQAATSQLPETDLPTPPEVPTI